MKARLRTAVAFAALCAAIPATAQVILDVTHTWSDPGLGGWTNGAPQVALSNPGGYLNFQFPAQTAPRSESDTVWSNVAESVVFTNVSFRFLAADIFPSAARLYAHSWKSGNSWYVALPDVSPGEWTTFNVPFDFAATNWIMGPDSSREQFMSDMLSVDWVGVYVRRHSDVIAQNYAIDDFRIQGVGIPASVSIGGDVGYNGELDGTIRVSIASTGGVAETTLSAPGSYEVGGLAIATDYAVSAYRDSNGDSTQDFWEANGAWTGNPARVYISNMTGVNIAMSDPTAPDGLPYWWLNRYFGLTNSIGYGGGGDSLASVDSDGDGANNYAEYRAGTDPTNFLSKFKIDIAVVNKEDGSRSVVIGWESASNKTYAVWRSEDLLSGFTRIDSGIVGAPPRNEYEDLTATNYLPYCYRIQLE